jgi:hypothetical protein
MKAETEGSAHTDYAAAFAQFGQPRLLVQSDG